MPIQFQIMQSRQFFRILLIIFFNFACLSYVSSEDSIDHYSPENVLKFADNLFNQGDYLRAIGEYQRHLFYKPVDNEQIQYKIALCYRLGGRPEQSIQAFQNLLSVSSDSKFVSSAYYQIGVSYFLLEQFGKSVDFLQTSLPRISDIRYSTEAQQVIGLSYLMQREWVAAENTFNNLLQSDVIEVREKAVTYNMYAQQGRQLPRRSPLLAGIMSTIVPGSGRLYTGRVNDAITSFITVGITGWQAYDGFRRDGLSSVKGWTLGTLSGIFYLGNIYGSVISARVYNDHVAEEFLSTLYITFPY